MSTSTSTVMSNANNNDDGILGASSNSGQDSCANSEVEHGKINVVNFPEKHSSSSHSSSVEQNIPELGSQVELSACANKVNDTSDSLYTAVSRKVGYAPIKQEFLVPDYKPKLHTEYVSSEVKDKLEDVDISQNHASDPEKRTAVVHEGEPPHKKAKLKGRNKHRPKNERMQDKDKICRSVKENKECRFGDKCKFSHDKEDFVSKKLPELEGPCYIYDTFGHCPYGISCRFAANHMTEDLQNKTNDNIYNKDTARKSINELSSDVRFKLWKRKYDFRRADQSVKDIQKTFRGWEDSSSSKNTIDNNVVSDKVETISTAAQISQPVVDLIGSSNTDSILCDKPTIVSPESQIGIVEKGSEMSSGATPDVAGKGSEMLPPGDSPAIAEKGPEMLPSGDSPAIAEKRPEMLSNGAAIAVADKSKDLVLPTTQIKVEQTSFGCITDEEVIRLQPREIKKIDFKNKLYLAPLTTVGNLPFRRICKTFGADITCGEMALVTQLLQGKQSEWSLIKRHPSEDLFGVQICGSYPDTMTRCAQLLTETCSIDFIDINCGCPIDLIYQKGMGSALMGKVTKLEQICRSMIGVMGNTPLTVKLRTGVFNNKNIAHSIVPRLRDAGVSLVTLHGRSREQRYTKLADWEYASQCATAAAPMPVFGNGDILSYEDTNLHFKNHGVSGVMIARGALIKPWIFTEIKEQRHWDISSGERFDILKKFANYGLEHWGSDHQGVENTRRFLLEWLSFLHRYIPVGVLEQLPQRINERPPYYIGRNDLETLMASANCADWIKISEMLLGPVPPNFLFLPKHKANAYQ